jgi:Reverse transcriptase (RNA-dependent DNA polymerase)
LHWVKKSGGVRPIAIGYTWRRIAAKCVSAYALSYLNDFFAPTQLGVGVSGGCEAAIHATRRFIEMMPQDYAVAKLDFSNAFNSLRRDSMLDAVHKTIPEIYKFCFLSYSQSSSLKYGSRSILSQEGSQQGDPLGPLLFCLTIHPILKSLSSELVIGYIDDITIGGSISSVQLDIDIITKHGSDYGLHLHIPKCELISNSSCKESSSLSDFIAVKPADACLLGAPLFAGSTLDQTLQHKFDELSRLSTNIRSISAHDALFILRFSLSTPKILHLLRCSPCYGHPTLSKIDDLLKANISYIANVDISLLQWLQASLPVKFGGLGVRSANSLALSAFLSSASSTRSMQDLILFSCITSSDHFYERYLAQWSFMFQCPPPENQSAFCQRSWDKPCVKSIVAYLRSSQSDTCNQARLLAVSAPHSGDWLFALPISSCGLRMDNEDIRVAVGLRLGTALCKSHVCRCGATVDTNGLHSLSCKQSSSKLIRHSAMNDIIYKSLSRADIPSVKEPSSLSRTDGKRPDGLSLIPWKGGKSVVWDVTVSDTVARSYVSSCAQSAGSAAEMASVKKHAKYTEIAKNHHFVPIAFETFGPIGQEGLSFLSELGRRIAATTGDVRESAFLFQRLSVILQHFNYICFKCSFSDDCFADDDIYI